MYKFDRNKLAMVMINKGIRKKDLADKLGWKTTQVSWAFNENFHPCLNTVGKLADALGVKWKELMTKEEDQNACF